MLLNTARDDFNRILFRAIAEADPEAAVKRHLYYRDGILTLSGSGFDPVNFELGRFRKVIVVGAGKATAPMARAMESILGDRLSGGTIVVKDGHRDDLRTIKQIEASHPVPDERGVHAAGELLSLLQNCDASDLVISLISGGGSSLLCLPARGISLEEKITTTGLLLKSGASIHEINAVRKHLSRIKGGFLAAACPAVIINLMVSDVVGDDMSVIASGPFYPDPTTRRHAREVLEKYRLVDSIPPSVLAILDDEVNETPKPSDPAFSKVHNVIVASNIQSLIAAKNEAFKLGYNSTILSSTIEGDTSCAAALHANIALESIRTGNPLRLPACLISGGETVVFVRGEGLGGRNMEFTMIAADLIAGTDGILMGSVGTDGTDGPTDAAGAVADGTTIARAEKAGLDIRDYMRRNDSYNFFRVLDDLVITGPTKTNVMDIRIILAGHP